MAKNYFHGKTTRKSLIAMLCALSVTCTGLATACTPEEQGEDPSTPAKEDAQLLKNGNFEFFNVPKDAVYLINNVNDWTRGGDSSVMSGIVNTSQAAWDKATDAELSDKLDVNNGLSKTDDDYVDYNSMHTRDIFYKDPYSALLTEENFKDDKIIGAQGYQEYFGIEGNATDGYTLDGKPVYKGSEDDKQFYFDEARTQPVRKALIANPGTHYGAETEKDGKYYLGDKEVYKDDDGNLFEDADKKNGVGNVLMVHNYATDGKYNGIQQYYTSATVTLEANTAAEISLWVKTSDLKFDKGYSALDEQDKGAYIEVIQTVSSTTLDSFTVKNINTEKIISYAEKDKVDLGENQSNGWLKYNIYVNACDFASSTVQIRLGLGQEGDAEKCTGYAFFDDVEVTKYRALSESESYKANSGKLDKTTCTLTSDKEAKIFNADKELRAGSDNARCSYDFHYAIDLASSTGANSYKSIALGESNVSTALTSEKDGKDLYSSAETNGAKLTGVTANDAAVLGNKTKYKLVKNTDPRPTDGDIVGTFAKDYNFGASDFNSGATDYSKLLNDNIKGGVPGQVGNTLVVLSAWGAGYTSTITDDSFTIPAKGYSIVSFWLKTSDMGGKTAATVKLYEDDKSQSLTVDTTGVTTDFEGAKDIYDGFVQCFFFVKNDNDEARTFKLDVSFGNTTVKDAGAYEGGWLAFADLQTLAIDEDVFNMAASGTYTGIFEFDKTKKEDGKTKMDEATGTSDIKKGIATPSNYSGINGASSTVTGGEARPSYDGANTHSVAGLISSENAESYAAQGAAWSDIAASFGKAGAKWSEVFGNECYQPLIIINNSIRCYAERKDADEDTYSHYYVIAEDGDAVDHVTADGKKYKRATSYDKDADYYAINEVFNYGFAGANKTVAADSYETVSVKVKVSGDAEAYVYLVDADDPSKVLGYSTPELTFYYDVEGNVLDAEYDEDWKESEHRSHIVYTLRDDGLYEDKDGKLFANLNNLIKNYKNYKFEHETFYDENGVAVSFDDLVNGENYYSTSNDKSVYSNHYLVNTKGTRVFEYDDGKYYYLENGKKTVEVNGFDPAIARYNYQSIGEKYAVKVGPTGDEWVTVNFFLHTGSEAKTYRLELWYGERGASGVESAIKKGAVAFDYSAYSVSSENYAKVIGEYETNVINAYKELLKDDLSVIESDDENIAFYESKLTAEQIKSVKDKFNYTAKYYTYTLYDSEAYVAFNANTAADGETGYEYKITDFDETLAYFRYDNERENSYNVFADYSAVDQSIEINKSTDDGDDGDEEEPTASGDVWLYVSSIILVVVLLITLVAMLLRTYFKKHGVKKSKKNLAKNNYRQRERYVRKLHLVKNEDLDEEVPTEEPAEETAEEPKEAPIEEPTEEPAEKTAEEAPAEEPTEETVDEPAEEPKEKTVEEPAEETADEPTEKPKEETVEEAPAEEPKDNGEEN